eukprot:606880-Prorocentrum_minimum.AAC.1
MGCFAVTASRPPPARSLYLRLAFFFTRRVKKLFVCLFVCLFVVPSLPLMSAMPAESDGGGERTARHPTDQGSPRRSGQ